MSRKVVMNFKYICAISSGLVDYMRNPTHRRPMFIDILFDGRVIGRMELTVGTNDLMIIGSSTEAGGLLVSGTGIS